MMVTLWWVLYVDVEEIAYLSGSPDYPPPGLVIVKDLCYGVVTAAYLVYIGFAAKAVDAQRKRERQGILELDDGMAIPLRNKSKTDTV